MEKLEELKEQIESERKILDRLALKGDSKEVYKQSLVVDKLMEEYLKTGTEIPA